ncbi:MAG: agmatine deiminase family protein, partial [Rhodothermales bacterium]|nr:agmatine deiminase family protein [Rhodothermales bacterium]
MTEVRPRGKTRMPAEWEPHRSTWLSWPHNRETWPGAFEAAEKAYARLVQVIADSEPVDINVLSEDHRTRVRALVGPTRYPIRTHLIPTNDAWCRDHSAVLVHEAEGGLAAVDFRYNAWGGKYPPF